MDEQHPRDHPRDPQGERSGSPRLRGHHLLCLRSYRGEGYGRPFVENLERVVGAIERSPATVVEGADDVCAACPSLESGRCEDPSTGEEEIRRLDRLACDLLDLRPGDVVDVGVLRRRSHDAWDAWREGACGTCGWVVTCAARGRPPVDTPSGY